VGAGGDRFLKLALGPIVVELVGVGARRLDRGGDSFAAFLAAAAAAAAMASAEPKARARAAFRRAA
jgi:hypothetical protein